MYNKLNKVMVKDRRIQQISRYTALFSKAAIILTFHKDSVTTQWGRI